VLRGLPICRRLQCDLGNDFLELPVLCAKILDIVAGRLPQRVAGELLLAGFEEVFGPAVVEVRGDAFTPTQVGHALLASQSLEDDADPLLGRELAACARADLPPDVLLKRGVYSPSAIWPMPLLFKDFNLRI